MKLTSVVGWGLGEHEKTRSSMYLIKFNPIIV